MDVIPHHVAIICDGNRRWAKARNLPAFVGHQKGFEAVQKISKHLREKGVHTLSLWVFSTENWNRSAEEVNNLMKLFEKVFDDHVEELLADKARLIHLGRKDRIPAKLLEKITAAEEKTKHFTDHVVNICLDYGGRDEILRAVAEISSDHVHELSEEIFEEYLDTKNQPHPNPDMLIRTGGEMRLSGFLLWQIEYAELFFPKETLPDLTPTLMDTLLEEYSHRQRRFGK